VAQFLINKWLNFYLRNTVIVTKEMTWEKIKQLAEEQVKKQWGL